MLKRLFNLFFDYCSAIFLAVSGLFRGFRFHPFARTKGRRVLVESGSSAKKVGLDSTGGAIVLRSGCWLNDGVEISSLNEVIIGAGTTVQRNVTINGEVRLGERCLLAPNVFISSTSHVHNRFPGLFIRDQEKKISREEFLNAYNKPVSIGDDVWIGVNSVVMPGIKIGSHVIVGANAVVTRDVPDGAIVAGVPAKILNYRLGFEEKDCVD